MSNPLGEPTTSVPAVPVKPPRVDISLWLPLPRLNARSWLGALLIAIILVAVSLVWSDPDRKNFLAAASLNFARFPIESVDCLAINPHGVVYDQKGFSDPELPEAITSALGIKTILPGADTATCRWGIDITVIAKADPHVRYNGDFSRYLVAIAICERSADGRMTDECISKNIYVFNPHVAPHDLFLIALDGLALRQTQEWQAFQRKKSE
jgi:hypothetical protein